MADINRLPNGNIELPIVLPWADIQKAYEKEVDHAVEHAKIEGFRPGKAPRDLVLKKLNQNDLYSHAIQHILPEVYAKVIKDAGIKPIVYPRLDLKKSAQGQDWEFIATTCEAPVVDLPDPLKLEKAKADATREQKLGTIIDTLRKSHTPTIPDILVEEESNHRLSALVENVTKLGLSMDQYLASKKTTKEDLLAKTAQEAKIDLEVEFLLQAIQSKNKLSDRKSTLDHLLSLV